MGESAGVREEEEEGEQQEVEDRMDDDDEGSAPPTKLVLLQVSQLWRDISLSGCKQINNPPPCNHVLQC